MNSEFERRKQSYTGDLMKAGESNEEFIKKWLIEQCKKEKKVLKDVREIKIAQKFDYDYLIDNKKIEVKRDNKIHEQQNISFEIFRLYDMCFNNKGEIYEGWGWRSKADIFIWRDSITNKMFIYNVQDIRKYILSKLRYKGLGKGKSFVTPWTEFTIPTDSEKITICWMIPIKDLEEIRIKNFKNIFTILST